MPFNQLNDYEPPVSGGTIPIQLPGSYPGNVPQPRGHNPSPLPPPTDYYVTRKEVRDLLAKYPIETLMKLVENATEGNLVTLGADGQVIDSQVNISALTTIIGNDSGKSARTIATEEVSKIVDGAPEALDTLKEAADIIENLTNQGKALQAELEKKASKRELSEATTAINESLEELGEAIDAKQSAFGEEQMAAVNSGVTADKVKKLDGIEKAIEEAVEPKADRSELPYKLVEQPIGDTQLQDHAMTHIVTENGTVVSCDWTAVSVYYSELLSIPLDPLITTVLLEDHDFGLGEKTYVVVHVEGYDDRFFLCPYGNDYLTVDDIGPVIDGFFPEDVSPENIRLFYEEKPVNEGATLDPMINKIILRTYGMDYGHQSLTPSDSDGTIPVYAIDSDGNTEEIFRITPSEGDYIYYDCMVIDSMTNDYSVHIQLSTGISYYMTLGSSSSTPFIPGEYVAGTLVGWDDDTGVETTIENVRILVPDLQAEYASGYGYMELDFYSKNDSSTPVATTPGTRHINDYNFGLGESFTGYVFHPCAFGVTGAIIDYSGSYEDTWVIATTIPWQDAPAAIFNSGASFDVSHVHIPKVSWALYLTSKNYEYKFRIPPPLPEGRVRDFGLCVDLDQESSLQLEGEGTVKEATEGALTLAAGRTMVYVTEPVSGELYASSKELPA